MSYVAVFSSAKSGSATPTGVFWGFLAAEQFLCCVYSYHRKDVVEAISLL